MGLNLIQNHIVLLKDRVRMEAYSKAIKEVVKPGDVVADIGCGLGVLSFMAIKAGASHVHAIEVEPNTLSYAKLVAKKNHLNKKITFHNGFSTEVSLRSKVDVVISEILGNIGLNENLLPTVIDAKKRLLKNGGKMLPSGIKIFIVPSSHKEWSDTANLLHNTNGVDLLPDLPDIDLGLPSISAKKEEFLATPQIFADINLLNVKKDNVTSKCRFKIKNNGVMAGFVVWFEVNLTQDISFSTAPDKPVTHWKQGFLPLRTPESVKAGQIVALELEVSPGAILAGPESIIGYNYNVVA